ncbi:MAG: hypothetical protein ABR985_04200 [Methanotrichaceae archaeon]
MSILSKYIYLHLNITKKVVSNDGTYIVCMIKVSNDRNKILQFLM